MQSDTARSLPSLLNTNRTRNYTLYDIFEVDEEEEEDQNDYFDNKFVMDATTARSKRNSVSSSYSFIDHLETIYEEEEEEL